MAGIFVKLHMMQQNAQQTLDPVTDEPEEPEEDEDDNSYLKMMTVTAILVTVNQYLLQSRARNFRTRNFPRYA